jgi:hypothetical protein
VSCSRNNSLPSHLIKCQSFSLAPQSSPPHGVHPCTLSQWTTPMLLPCLARLAKSCLANDRPYRKQKVSADGLQGPWGKAISSAFWSPWLLTKGRAAELKIVIQYSI